MCLKRFGFIRAADSIEHWPLYEACEMHINISTSFPKDQKTNKETSI